MTTEQMDAAGSSTDSASEDDPPAATWRRHWLAKRAVDGSSRVSRRRFSIALGLALLLHALLLLLLIRATYPPSGTQYQAKVIQLRLIEPLLPPHVASLPSGDSLAQEVASEPLARTVQRSIDRTPSAQAKPSEAQQARARAVDDARNHPMVSGAHSEVSAKVEIFRRDGSVILPDIALETSPGHFSSEKKVALYAPDPMRHRSPLPYEPTRFEKDWVPLDETPLAALLRKATVSKTWDTQGGTRIQCTTILVLGVCGWGHIPRASIEELKKMRADPPMPKKPRDESASSP